MCVIAFAPAGVDLPNDQLIEDMFESNSDGAGFAYTYNKRVYVEKGFMTLIDFQRALALAEKNLIKRNLSFKDVPVYLHFRIGTHGPNSAGLTHPFPITQHKDFLEALDYYTDVAVAHNGIISSVKTKSGISDTVQYIKDVLLPLYRSNAEFYLDDNIQDLVENTIDGSRFIFLDRKGQHTLIGEWKTYDKAPGVMFSNLHFTYTPVYNYGYSYGKTAKSKSKKVKVKQLPHNPDFKLVYTNYSTGEAQLSEPHFDLYDYYVDSLGQVYYDDYLYKGTLRPQYYFDSVVRYDDKDLLPVCSDDVLLEDVKEISMKVRYDTAY